MSDLLKDILEYETIEYIKTNQYKESFFKKQLSNHVGIKKAKDHINDYNIKSGDLILVDDIISIVEKIYNDNNIMIKPKKSSVNDFFVTKHKMIDNVKYIQIEWDNGRGDTGNNGVCSGICDKKSLRQRHKTIQ